MAVQDRKEMLRVLGFVLSSGYRLQIISELAKSELTPTLIAKSTGISINHVSNVLRDLSDQNLIACANPQARKGRLYTLTKRGEDVSDLLDKIHKWLE